MTLQPSLPSLCLLPLLLLSGVLCQEETGFETESPVRTLQVETLVRSASWSTGAGPSAGIMGLKDLRAGGRGSMGTELGGAGSRRKNGIFGRSSVTPVVRSIIGGAPRTVCGASCLWRHASHTLHGEGSGGLGRGLGGGGAPMKHVSFGLDAWQAVREYLRALGS